MERTIAPCKQAIKDAGLKASEIDEVILVGGSSRIPKIQEKVKDISEFDEAFYKDDPK